MKSRSIQYSTAPNVRDTAATRYTKPVVEFLALFLKTHGTEKDGLALCATHFTGDVRAAENAETFDSIALDIDGHAGTVEDLREIFKGYAHALYTTFSYGVKPGLSSRVILPFTRSVSKEEFDLVWIAVARWMESFGIELDAATKNPDRLIFAPREQNPESDLVPVRYVAEGALFDVDALQ